MLIEGHSQKVYLVPDVRFNDPNPALAFGELEAAEKQCEIFGIDATVIRETTIRLEAVSVPKFFAAVNWGGRVTAFRIQSWPFEAAMQGGQFHAFSDTIEDAIKSVLDQKNAFVEAPLPA